MLLRTGTRCEGPLHCKRHTLTYLSSQSIESRESASRSLCELKIPAVVRSERFSRLLLRLLQDDDTTVREVATTVATRVWTGGMLTTERRVIEAILASAGPASLLECEEELRKSAHCSLSFKVGGLMFSIRRCRSQPPLQPFVSPLRDRKAQHLRRRPPRSRAPHSEHSADSRLGRHHQFDAQRRRFRTRGIVVEPS